MDGREIEAKLEVLLKDYETNWQQIQMRIGINEKIVGFGLTVLGAGLIYGIKEKVVEILLPLPVGVFGLIFYSVFITTDIMSLGGYRRYLEERINTILGENVLMGEKRAEKFIHRNFSLIWLYIIYFLSLGITIFLSLQNTLQVYGLRAFFGLSLFLLAWIP
ncbi:MAG: hypothetical protein ABSB32_21530, partial [Thermodesulfobacteriota bacterium]